jgi:O-antigen/teichoic acid export membrane protein
VNRQFNIISGLSTARALQVFQLLRFAGFFLTGILLAKSAIGTETIGVYETLMFLSAATGFFWVSGILNSLLASYSGTEETRRGQLLYNALLLLSFLNLVLIIILKFFEEDVLQLTGSGIQPYYNQILILMLFNNPSFLAEYVLLLLNKKKLLLTYGVLIFSLSLLLTVLPFYFNGNLEQSLSALILLSVCKFIFTAYLLSGATFSFSDIKGVKQQLYFAAPLISGMMISGSAEYIDGFLVTSHFGAESFALFRYGAREFPISLLMANALSMAMVPLIASQRAEGIEELKQESKKLMHWFFIPVCILVLFSNKIYPLLFREEFAASAPIFNIYLLLLISRMIFPQTIIMGLQKNTILFRVSIIELAANVCFSVLLLNLIGMKGIAYGTVIAFTLEKLILVMYLKKKQQISPETYTDLRTWFIYSLILLACFLSVA